jgi:putative ABC transport system permease protein
MSLLARDVRHAFRLLGRSPLFALVSILTLALGIGANTAIFSVVEGVLLKSLPYLAAERVMSIYSQFPALGFDRFPVSPPEFLEYQRMQRSFAGMGAYRVGSYNLLGRTEPLHVVGAAATASLLTTLGVQPALGHPFTAADDVPRAEPVVLLGDGLWRRAFAADPGVVGRRVVVDAVPRTVAGVLPPSFDLGGQHLQLLVPLALGPLNLEESELHSLFLVGRLRAGVSPAQARAELDTLLAGWPQMLPGRHTPDAKRHRLAVQPMLDDLVGETRPAMRVLVGAVACVLLIACINVAGLLLARAESRRKEIALRSALGAGQSVLLRQFLVESLILALLGGAVGLLLARWGVQAILAVNPESVPRAQEIGVDARVLLFTLAVATAAGVLFGLTPALYIRAAELATQLRQAGARSTAGAARQRFRRLLVGSEIALAAALVIGGGLLLCSFWRLRQVAPGFRPDHLLSLRLELPDSSYPQPEKAAAFYRELTARLAALPGIEGAAAMTGLPPKRDADSNETLFESVPVDPKGPPHSVDYWQYVTADSFRTMGIPIVAGRAFSAADDRHAPPVAIINVAMAQLFWPGKDPIGQRLRGTDHTAWMTIVGIAGDVKQGGLREKTGTEMYLLESQAQETVGGVPRGLYVVVRTAGEPLGAVGAVRAEIRRMDPALPIGDVLPMTEVVARSLDQQRFLMLLVVAFAAIALILAGVGIYGLFAFAVAGRRQEFGVRMALGARRAEVLRGVLWQGLKLLAAGLLCGVLGALALRRLLAGLLFGISAADPLIFCSVAALLTLVGLAACYLPARSAMRVDPATALREE